MIRAGDQHNLWVELRSQEEHDWTLGTVDPGAATRVGAMNGAVQDITVGDFPSCPCSVRRAPEQLALLADDEQPRRCAPRWWRRSHARSAATVYRSATLDGGSGRDTLEVNCGSSLALDLPKERLVIDGKLGKAATVSGWETVRLDSRHVTAKGDAKANTLTADACRAVVRPGGDYVLRLSLDSSDGCKNQERRLLGGTGADRLIGPRSAGLSGLQRLRTAVPRGSAQPKTSLLAAQGSYLLMPEWSCASGGWSVLTRRLSPQ